MFLGFPVLDQKVNSISRQTTFFYILENKMAKEQISTGYDRCMGLTYSQGREGVILKGVIRTIWSLTLHYTKSVVFAIKIKGNLIVNFTCDRYFIT